MTHTEIVNRLIGKIDPVGETNEDHKRLDNLRQQCILVNELLEQIEKLGYKYIGSHEYSVKKIADFARGFIEEQVKIRS